MMYQESVLQDILYNIYERMLTDEDKQYKLDLEDLIEEQLYQCV